VIEPRKNFYLIVFIGFLSIALGSCAYYNTFYNAEQYFKQGIEELEKSSDGKITVNVRKNFNTAIEKSNKVILTYPDSRWTDDAAYIIAMSQYYKTDYSASRKSFEHYFATYPASELRARAEIWYGRCLWKMGEKEQSLRQLKISSQREKNPVMKSEIFFALADLHQSSGNLDSALIYYRLTTKAGRDIPMAALAQYNIAEINLKQNQIDKAITNLKKVNNFAPSLELKNKMQILLAQIYREAGRFDEARDLINAKLNDIANESVWGDLEFQLGLLFLAEGDYESAESRFSQVTEKYQGKPVSAEAYHQLGQLYMIHLGDYEKAQKSFEMVKREDRNSKFVLDSQNKITEIKRFFSLNTKFTESWKKVKPYVDQIEGRIDTSDIDISSDEKPEVLKKAIEQYEEEKMIMSDTVSVFLEYYQVMYEIGELYYFDFNKTDSAYYYFNRVFSTNYYNTIRDKALYAVYFLLIESGKSDLANTYLDTMKSEFPKSPYLRFIETGDIKLPEDNIQARQVFLNGEKYFDFQPDSSIAVFSGIIDDFPTTLYAEKSMLSIAWITKNRYYDLDKSTYWYQKFIEVYPESDMLSYAQSELSELKSIVDWLIESEKDTVKDTTNTILPAELGDEETDVPAIRNN